MLHLEDEAMRIEVGIRLGTLICHIHTCLCGAIFDARHCFIVFFVEEAPASKPDI